MSPSLGRRPFLGTLASLAGIAAVAPGCALAATRSATAAGSSAPSGKWDRSWLDALTGKHRQVFSAQTMALGLAQEHGFSYEPLG